MALFADKGKPAAKGKGGSVLSKKVFGVPVPVLAIGGGVVGVILYRRYAANQAATAASGSASSTTPTDSGTVGSGSGASGSSDSGAGGAFVPQAPNIIIRQPIRNITRIIRRPRRGGPVRRRPLVVNRIIVNPRYPTRAPVRRPGTRQGGGFKAREPGPVGTRGTPPRR